MTNRRLKQQSAKSSKDLLELLKFPNSTLNEEAKNLAKVASGLGAIRELQRERALGLAAQMLQRANLNSELEAADVTVTEDGFTVEFRFR